MQQVSFGLSLSGQLSWLRTAFLIPAQLLASMVAGGLVEVMFPGSIEDVTTLLSSGTSVAQGLFIEMFLTAQLVFVILMLAVEKSKDTFLAPIGIGLALFVAELSGKFWTTCHMLPAILTNLQASFTPEAPSTRPAASDVPSQAKVS